MSNAMQLEFLRKRHACRGRAEPVLVERGQRQRIRSDLIKVIPRICNTQADCPEGLGQRLVRNLQFEGMMNSP
jgi:hypothetical protein